MVIDKARADKCVTHHAACDCREYRAQAMERTLEMIERMCSEGMDGKRHHARLVEDIHRMAGNALNALSNACEH